jgi:hypothetical protein
MIYKKRKKNGEKGHQIFYLSREHYQQRFYMEPLLIVHQHRFRGKTAVDSWHYKFETHLRPEITWQNFISLARCRRRTTKEATRAHSMAVGTPSMLPPSGPHHYCRGHRAGTPTSPQPPCRDPFSAAAAPHVEKSSMQLPRPLHWRCHWSAADLTPLCYITSSIAIHHCPNISAFFGLGSARSPWSSMPRCLKPPSVTIAQVSSAWVMHTTFCIFVSSYSLSLFQLTSYRLKQPSIARDSVS